MLQVQNEYKLQMASGCRAYALDRGALASLQLLVITTLLFEGEFKPVHSRSVRIQELNLCSKLLRSTILATLPSNHRSDFKWS